MSKVFGRKIELPGGRSCFVGMRDDGSEDTYIEFVNGTQVNRLKLTAEGTINLRLLLDPKSKVGEPAEYEVGEQESTLRTWQLVKERRA